MSNEKSKIEKLAELFPNSKEDVVIICDESDLIEFKQDVEKRFHSNSSVLKAEFKNTQIPKTLTFSAFFRGTNFYFIDKKNSDLFFKNKQHE